MNAFALSCATFISLVNAVDYIDSLWWQHTHTHTISPLSNSQVYNTVLSTTCTWCTTDSRIPGPAWLKLDTHQTTPHFSPSVCLFYFDLIYFTPIFFSSTKCRCFYVYRLDNVFMKWQVCVISIQNEKQRFGRYPWQVEECLPCQEGLCPIQLIVASRSIILRNHRCKCEIFVSLATIFLSSAACGLHKTLAGQISSVCNLR